MRLSALTEAIWQNNPTFVLMLGLCPTLAVTTGLGNAIGMGAAATFVLIGSNMIISMIKGVVPGKIRIPCYIVVIAVFVSITQLILKAHMPALDESLGIFLPLIVVNCIILGRAEAFAAKNPVLDSILDGIGSGIGFTMGLGVIAVIREILGTGQIMGVPVTAAFGPDGAVKPAGIMVMAPGAFLVLSLMLGFMAWRKQRAGK